MTQRRVKAKYRTGPPKKVKVVVTEARMVKEEGTDSHSLEKENKVIEKEMYMVYFPQGHSIRCDRAELVRMGYHLRPRLIDMDSGETIDFGGDPYDFMGMPNEGTSDDEFDIHLIDDDANEDGDSTTDIEVEKVAAKK